MKQRHSIRFIFSTFVIIIAVITSGCILLITNSLYIKNNKKNITDLLQAQAKQEAAILSYQLNAAGLTAVNIADMIEIMPVYDQSIIFQKIDEKLSYEKLLFGMGVWLEPGQFREGQKYYGPYMFRDNQGKNRLIWDYNTPEYDYFNWDWYRVTESSPKRDIYFSQAYYDQVLNTFFLTTTAPIIKEGKFIGVATTDISIREVADYVQGIHVGYHGYGFVQTNNGYVIGNPPFIADREKSDGFNLRDSAVDSSNSENMEYINLQKTAKDSSAGFADLPDNKEIAAYANIGDTGLSLVLIYPQSELYGNFYQTLGYYSLLFLITTGLCLLLVRLFMRKIIEQPIGRLMSKVGRIMKGDFRQDDGLLSAANSRNEFDIIGQAVNRMAESLDGLVWDLNQQNIKLVNSRKEMAISEEKYRYLAYYDTLTALPNRANFDEKVNRIIRDTGSEKFAVFFMDLDNFKVINDTMGHESGDQVLLCIAQRLNSLTDERIWVSRFGGDEFIMIVQGISGRSDCELITAEVHRLVNQPITINDNQHYVNVSIGIAIYPDDGANLNALLRNSDTAMFAGKAKGKDRSTYYESEMNETIVGITALENKLRRALEQEEFILYYQPLFAMKEEKVIGFEALIRWAAPGEEVVLPGMFIQIMEESRLIIPLGKWIIHTACRFIRRLMDEGYLEMRIAINVSVIQMREKNFSEIVLQAIAQAGISATNLEIEITESKLMEFYGDCMENITRLRGAGIGFVIDDFGSGYSSFSYLRQLPINAIKIDRSFIEDLSADHETNLAELIIIVAHKMGLEVIGEGVETPVQYSLLQHYACNIVQGFLISRPLPEAAAMLYLQESLQDDPIFQVI